MNVRILFETHLKMETLCVNSKEKKQEDFFLIVHIVVTIFNDSQDLFVVVFF